MTDPVKDSDRDWWYDETEWAEDAYWYTLASHFEDEYERLQQNYPEYFSDCE